MNKILALSLLLSLCATAATADVKPHGMFNDHAVLQRGINIPVWGTAANGEKITVSMNGQTVSTVAQNGKWEVSFQPMARATSAMHGSRSGAADQARRWTV